MFVAFILSCLDIEPRLPVLKVNAWIRHIICNGAPPSINDSIEVARAVWQHFDPHTRAVGLHCVLAKAFLRR